MTNYTDELTNDELRALASVLAMQGLLAGGERWTDPEKVADRAVVIAEALLARLAQ